MMQTVGAMPNMMQTRAAPTVMAAPTYGSVGAGLPFGSVSMSMPTTTMPGTVIRADHNKTVMIAVHTAHFSLWSDRFVIGAQLDSLLRRVCVIGVACSGP